MRNFTESSSLSYTNSGFDIESASDSNENVHLPSTRKYSSFEQFCGVLVRGLYYSPSSSSSFKNRKETDLLYDVNLTIPRGSIFGLLGPSGCGKTTLLRCILGCITPQSGQILVLGRSPGARNSDIPGKNVGYMPQENALHEEMSIGEILYYYGKIYQICPKVVKQRINQLVQMLDLPPKNRQISGLSGGQKRRVTFCIALIHRPSFLVLDEPTSGVDPVLREKIWSLLLNISATNGCTIIITTHYIEEARRSHLVGFMRNGHILLQESPSKLMEQYGTLEETFLNLCKKVTSSTHQSEDSLLSTNMTSMMMRSQTDRIKYEICSTIGEDFRNHTTIRWTNFKAWLIISLVLFIRYLKHDLFNIFVIVFQYILPISQVILFSYCIGGSPLGIPLAVVNQEMNPDLSSNFLKGLDNQILRLVNYSDYETALRDAEQLQVRGILHIPNDFSTNFIERLFTNDDLSSSQINRSIIHLTMDTTDKLISASVERYLDQYILKFAHRVLMDFEDSYNMVWSNLIANPPIRLEKKVYGYDQTDNYRGARDYMFPGMVINLIYASSFGMLALALINERENQSFERSLIAGVKPYQMILSLSISRAIFMAPFSLLVIWLPVIIFKFPVNFYSLIRSLPLLLMVSLAGIGHGIVLATLCQSIGMTCVLAVGTLFAILFISGTLWPLEAIPIRYRFFVNASPTTLATETLRNIMFKGWTSFSYEALPAHCILAAWLLVSLLFGYKFFRTNQSSGRK
ncbi:ABC transporter G family member 20-like [Brevipalpus obovatus]|uniref:ABC transporter G family member 20-like n=1 Tax=Brevipalpus obovatus TaxID=246614 RepID=UPI003D9DEE61